MPGFGWAIGLDRLASVVQQVHGDPPAEPTALLIPLGDAAGVKALELARALWAAGRSVQLETRGGNLKKALASANRQGANLALILGDGELERRVGIPAKNLATGTQEDWPWAELAARLAP